MSSELRDAQSSAPSVVSIRSDWDIIAARMAARDTARKMGFSTIDQARIATVTSELTRKIMHESGTGSVTIGSIERAGRAGIEIIFEERQSSAFLDTLYALNNTDGATTNGSIEILIGSLRHLMDEFDLETDLEHGMVIICRKWLR